MNNFEHVNLDEIDPSFKTIPKDTYAVRITKAEPVAYGADGAERFSMTLVIVDHPEFAARRIFPSIFPGEWGLKVLKRISDATGIPQGTDTVAEWGKRLVQEAAEFKVFIDEQEDVDYKTKLPNPKTVKPDGTPALKNEADFRKIFPRD